jgi:hypothetical protein
MACHHWKLVLLVLLVYSYTATAHTATAAGPPAAQQQPATLAAEDDVPLLRERPLHTKHGMARLVDFQPNAYWKEVDYASFYDELESLQQGGDTLLVRACVCACVRCV